MKILNIEIKNNKTIGDLSLDFTNDNISSNCVVLVGDNGTGKSTILKAIKSMFSDAGDVYYDSFEGEIRIKVELSESTKEI
jgi:predicted ATP-dependent endonuclease of OLD family